MTTTSTTTPAAAEPHLPPIRMDITVARSPEDACRVFTEEIHTWWPLATHSIGQEDAAFCGFEGRVGGRIFERLADGSEHEWGRVLAWEPPRRLRFTWHPGRDADTAQQVEVRFHAVEGEVETTRVELVHEGWEHYGEGAAEAHAGYQPGWEHVLGECYGGSAGRIIP